MNIKDTKSIGAASISATATELFTFTTGGNVLILSTEAGGLLRVNVDGNNPQSTLATEDEEDFFIFCDGGNVRLDFPKRQNSSDYIQYVRVYAVSAVTNIGVTLGVNP